MSITEDFSFPKLTSTNNSNNNNNPLSLWRISSLVYPDQEEEKEENDYGVVRKHKSFSELEMGDSETRMDLLWEDFNEKELQRVSSLDRRIKSRRLLPTIITTISDNYVTNDANNNCGYFHGVGDPVSGHNVEDSKSKASKQGCILVRRPRRPSTTVFMRALRKLFSLHNLTRDKKNH